MKTLLYAAAIGVAASFAVAAHAAEDTFRLSTINPPTGTTDCRRAFIGDVLGERFALVRGRPNHSIRIEKHLIDVGLERATVANCSSCDVAIRNKGNFDSGSNGNLVDRKGFVELEVNTPSDAPTGNTNLVLHYFGGGRGEYKLLIVRNSRVDSIEAVNVSNPTDRVRLQGNNLDRLVNNFPDFTRVSETDATLTLAPVNRVCRARTAELDLVVEASQFCRIGGVKIPLARDPACPADGNAAPPPPPANPPPPPPGVGGNTGAVRLNLTPALITPTPFFRSLGALLPDNTAQRRRTSDAFCASFGNDEERSITLPPIRWGIAYAGLPSPSPVSADVLDGNGNRLQRRTADPITVGNGSDSRFFDNWTGRTTTVRVINAQSVAARARMGVPPAPGQTSPAGCYLAPGEPLTRFDPPRLTFRVNTGTPPAAETQTNDNEISL